MIASTIARTVSCGATVVGVIVVFSPAALLFLVLFLEPGLKRRAVIEDRRGIHLTRSRELEERVLPRRTCALREHRAELAARDLVPVARALGQRPLEPGRLAQRLVELKLDDEGQEIACVRHVSRHVILGAGIE